MDKKEKIR